MRDAEPSVVSGQMLYGLHHVQLDDTVRRPLAIIDQLHTELGVTTYGAEVLFGQ